MKPVTTYESFNGLIFDTAEECAKYETHCYKIAKMVDRLPRFTVDEDYEQGKTYYQHDPSTVIDIRSDFCMYMDSLYNNFVFRQQIGERVLLMDTKWYYDFFGVIHDLPSLLAWRYIGCIDNQYRQWYSIEHMTDPPDGATALN